MVPVSSLVAPVRRSEPPVARLCSCHGSQTTSPGCVSAARLWLETLQQTGEGSFRILPRSDWIIGLSDRHRPLGRGGDEEMGCDLGIARRVDHVSLLEALERRHHGAERVPRIDLSPGSPIPGLPGLPRRRATAREDLRTHRKKAERPFATAARGDPHGLLPPPSHILQDLALNLSRGRRNRGADKATVGLASLDMLQRSISEHPATAWVGAMAELPACALYAVSRHRIILLGDASLPNRWSVYWTADARGGLGALPGQWAAASAHRPLHSSTEGIIRGAAADTADRALLGRGTLWRRPQAP